MSKSKFYEIIVTSNHKNHSKRWAIKSSTFKALFFFLFVFCFFIFFVTFDYFGLLLDQQSIQALKKKNEILNKNVTQLRAKVSDYQIQVEKVEVFSEKIKKIIDLDNKSYLRRLGVHPTPVKNFQKESQRSIASMLKEGTPLEGVIHIENLDSNHKQLMVHIDKNLEKASLQEQNVIQLWSQLSEKKNIFKSIPNIKPTLGWVSSHFGHRIDPINKDMSMHHGIDIVSPQGTPVYAPAGGRVYYIGYDKGYGKIVIINHGYGVTTRYGHNSEILVSVGDVVKRWDVIATVGNTGRSTGAHLHYEVRVHGIPVDPRNYILNL